MDLTHKHMGREDKERERNRGKQYCIFIVQDNDGEVTETLMTWVMAQIGCEEGGGMKNEKGAMSASWNSFIIKLGAFEFVL